MERDPALGPVRKVTCCWWNQGPQGIYSKPEIPDFWALQKMRPLGIRVHYSTALCSVPGEKVSHCPSLTSQAGPRLELSSSYLRHVTSSTLVDQRAVDSESCCLVFPEENHERRIAAVCGFPRTFNLAALLFCFAYLLVSPAQPKACENSSLLGWLWCPWNEWRNPRSVSLHLQNGNDLTPVYPLQGQARWHMQKSHEVPQKWEEGVHGS